MTKKRGKSSTKKSKTKITKNTVGLIFIVLGVICLFDIKGIFVALSTILFGVSLLDITTRYISGKTNNEYIWVLVSVFCFVLLGLSGATLPDSKDDTVKAVEPTKTATVVSIIVPTSTPEQSIEPLPTLTPTPSVTSAVTHQTAASNGVSTDNQEVSNDASMADYETATASVSVDACDLSGYRQSNAVVDIGYGDREYWAYTNEYGQLVRVTAAEIILQDDSEANSNGRYCSDEAKVPGVEDPDLDEGHIIADSLGGVSNAYNITPMNSTLNRYGDQAYMEKTIRDAGGATDFECIITYPNTETMTPSHYKYTYTVWGNQVVDEFDNVNPEDTIPDSNNSSNSGNTYVAPSKSQAQLDCENGGGTWREGSWCEWPKSQAQIDCENRGGVWTDNSWCNLPQSQSQQNSGSVWVSATGSKYHSIPNCGNMNPDKAIQMTLADAQSQGYGQCSRCW